MLLNDDGALILSCNRIRSRLRLLLTVEVLRLTVAIVHAPNIPFLGDPDRQSAFRHTASFPRTQGRILRGHASSATRHRQLDRTDRPAVSYVFRGWEPAVPDALGAVSRTVVSGERGEDGRPKTSTKQHESVGIQLSASSLGQRPSGRRFGRGRMTPRFAPGVCRGEKWMALNYGLGDPRHLAAAALRVIAEQLERAATSARAR